MLRVREFFAGPDITLVGCGQHQFSFLVGSANICWVSPKSCPFEWPRTRQHLLFSLLAGPHTVSNSALSPYYAVGCSLRVAFGAPVSFPPWSIRGILYKSAGCINEIPLWELLVSLYIVSFLPVMKIHFYFLFWKAFKIFKLIENLQDNEVPYTLHLQSTNY